MKTKVYGSFTEEIKQMIKDKFIDLTRQTLTEYDPDEDSPRGVIAAIGSAVILMDDICEELDKEKEV